MKQALFTLPCLLLSLPVCSAADADTAISVHSATHRGLALITRGATNWQAHKTCFSCHHQTLPMLAVIESASVGFEMNKAWLNSQADTTHKYFQVRIDTMNAGDHVPGGSTTAGYGLWALSMAERPGDETTTAVVTYLLKIQGTARLEGREPTELKRVQDGRWTTSCRRLPLQGSDIADTVLALLGMKQYATAQQQSNVARASAAAEKWLQQTPLKTQEDRIWRLWGLHQMGGNAEAKQATLAAIISAQREDGGWPQSDDRTSDAFSTGQTLFMLCKTGTLPDNPMVQRARDYLLRTQLADGSWLVESHVKYKAQPYFENGDPHGEHQFLSVAATAWSTAALAQLLPPKLGPDTR
jgi:hypothetical protein